MRRRFGVRVRTAQFVLLAALITGGMLSAASFASTDTKKARGDFVPSAAAAGATSTYRLELTNDVTSNQTFGSANVSIPTGFNVDGTSITADRSWTASLNSTSGLIELRAVTSKRALPPGQKLVVTFTATAPCEVGTYVWQTLIKQSNDFNGTGNDFVVDPQPSVTVSGTCGGGGGTVCTAGPCTAIDEAGVTSVTTRVPAGATLTIAFDNESSECVDDLIGSRVSLVPSGTWGANEVMFEWDKSVAPGTGVSNFKLCWSKPDQAAAELPKCAKKNPEPTCELRRSRNGAGDLQIFVLLGEDPDFELG